jgi:SAM-dependent methyltransferase
MKESSLPSLLDKRAFYRQSSVVSEYDRLRFGSPSGQWVNDRELGLVTDLLPPPGRVLDLGCGTGRLSHHLASRGYSVVALDTSAEMLERAHTAEVPAIQADGFSLPFGDDAFDAVVALRVAFHYADLGSLLAAARAVLRPGGTLVFDTYRWTPRALFALDASRWGGKVFTHAPAAVALAASRVNLKVVEQRSAFLFSPYVYRMLPMPLVQAFSQVEARVPSSVRARIFWRLRDERG